MPSCLRRKILFNWRWIWSNKKGPRMWPFFIANLAKLHRRSKRRSALGGLGDVIRLAVQVTAHHGKISAGCQNANSTYRRAEGREHHGCNSDSQDRKYVGSDGGAQKPEHFVEAEGCAQCA